MYIVYIYVYYNDSKYFSQVKRNSDFIIFTRLLKTHPFYLLEISVFLRSFFKPSSFNDLSTLINLWFLSPLELFFLYSSQRQLYLKYVTNKLRFFSRFSLN